MKKYRIIIIFAVIIVLFIGFKSLAPEVFDYLGSWKETSQERIKVFEELLDSGAGQKLDISVEDKGVRVTAEGVISDDFNTLILLKVEDLDGIYRFGDGPNIKDGMNVAEMIEVDGDLKRFDRDHPVNVNSINLYQEEEGINKIILSTKPLIGESGNINIKIREFMSMLDEDGQYLTLGRVDEEEVKRVKGNWDMEIEAKKTESYKYKVDKEISLDGNKIRINNITIAPSETHLEYEFNAQNKEEDYYLNTMDFSIEYDGRVYGISKLGFSYNMAFGGLFTRESRSLETLYLENPDKITLILESYDYDRRNKIAYDIDRDNLPQELEYEGSIITIESIRNTEESTEITIKEDESEDREYIMTNMHVETQLEDSKMQVASYQTHADFGVVKKDEKIKTQKIEIFKDFILPKSQAMGLDIEGSEEEIRRILNPEKIYIEGQSYTEYPKEKIDIELKK